jgi:hypothetical protein
MEKAASVSPQEVRPLYELKFREIVYLSSEGGVFRMNPWRARALKCKDVKAKPIPLQLQHFP